jgi:hypothetical protein
VRAGYGKKLPKLHKVLLLPEFLEDDRGEG